MAINIEWQVKPPSKTEDKPLMFPRITDSEIVNERQLSELMASLGSLFRGKAKSALGDMAEVMADQLIPQLLTYFKTHDSITRDEFERTFGLKRTTAYMRLKELEKKGVIHAVGDGRERKYVSIYLQE